MFNSKAIITRIAVEGFKSLVDRSEVKVKPLTLLCGANSSGKSSLMQPLLLLKQTVERPSAPGPLLLDGDNVRFTEASQMIARVAGRDSPALFCFGITLDSGLSIEMQYKYGTAGLTLVEQRLTEGDREWRFRPGMSDAEVLRLLEEDLPPPPQNHELTASLREQWPFLHPLGGLRKESGEEPLLMLPLGTPAFEVALQNLVHVPALRGNPQRSYPTSFKGPPFRGTFEDYTATTIFVWQTIDDNALQTLSSWLQDLGLTWKIVAEQRGDTRVDIRVGRLSKAARGGAYDLVSIADVGFGVSQVLPALVALLAAQKGSLVYLEQPEIHLHPRAQHALAGPLASAATAGKNVVVETHSASLLRGIQTEVAKGALSPDQVGLYWFHRGADGITGVTLGSLAEDGSYGEWPIDFDEVEMQISRNLLNAAWGDHRQSGS